MLEYASAVRNISHVRAGVTFFSIFHFLYITRKSSTVGENKQTDGIRKIIISIFKNIDFKIEIVTNLTEVDFLDVTFNLENNTCCPYKKKNDKSICINVSSNHPLQIKKQLTKIISDTLSRNFSSA